MSRGSHTALVSVWRGFPQVSDNLVHAVVLELVCMSHRRKRLLHWLRFVNCLHLIYSIVMALAVFHFPFWQLEFLLLLQATHYTINYPIQNKHYTKSILGDRLNILFFFFPHHAAVDITMANTTQK